MGGSQVQENLAGTELGNDALPPMPNRSGPDTARLSINVLITSPASPLETFSYRNSHKTFSNIPYLIDLTVVHLNGKISEQKLER